MRETANLKLTQFDGSDVPNWLDQYNSDNLKIDTAIGEQAVKNTEFSNTNENLQVQITNNRNQIDENTQDIANAKKDIADIKKGSSTSLAEIDKKFVATDAQISGLKTQVGNSDFSNVGASITEIIGNTPITGNDTISHDLQTIHNDLDSVKDQNSRITNLEKSVGNASIKNVGNSVTEAIGNTELPLSSISLSDAVHSVYGAVEVTSEDTNNLKKTVKKIGTNLTNQNTIVLHRGNFTDLNTITISSAEKEGHYMATALVEIESNNTGYRRCELKRTRNSITETLGYFSTNAVTGAATKFTLSTLPFDVKINDVFTLSGYQSSDATSLNTNSILSLFRLRE